MISYWEGLRMVKWTVFEKCTLDTLQDEIKKQAERYNINMRHVRVDVDGLGG